MALLQINNIEKCDNNKRERKKKKKEKEVVDEQLGLHGFESYYFNNQVKCADEKNDLWPVSFYNRRVGGGVRGVRTNSLWWSIMEG